MKIFYKEQSPIESIDTLSCPILLLQGDEDKIVPPNQAEMMHAALLDKGIPKKNHLLVDDPFTTQGSTWLHELGHCTLTELSIYIGETEAVNNYFYTYDMNVKIGKSLDESFMKSFSYPHS